MVQLLCNNLRRNPIKKPSNEGRKIEVEIITIITNVFLGPISSDIDIMTDFIVTIHELLTSFLLT